MFFSHLGFRCDSTLCCWYSWLLQWCLLTAGFSNPLPPKHINIINGYEVFKYQEFLSWNDHKKLIPYPDPQKRTVPVPRFRTLASFRELTVPDQLLKFTGTAVTVTEKWFLCKASTLNRIFLTPWIRDPRWKQIQIRDPGQTSWILSSYFWELSTGISFSVFLFGLKMPKFFVADPDPG